jgi:hypothetical protein
MYTIKAFVDGKEYMLHKPGVKALTVGDPYYQKGDNVNGQAEFTVYPTHPYYQYVKKLTTEIIFYKDGAEKFAGRVLYDDEDFNGSKKVFVEGELAYFCDSIQRPKVYHNYSVKAYLGALIDNHNSQVEERKQFVLGRVSVTDPNDSLYRYSNWEDTRTTLKEKLTSRLGGHLVIRKENGVRYLDYLNDDEFYKQNTQTIRFGKNLLDFSRNIDASDLVTCVIPLGAKLEESSIEGLEERLTITSVNGGVDYVSDDNAVAAYGKIYKTVTWDDVTVASNLMKKAREYLKSVQFEKMILDLKAVDMNLTSDQIQEFEIGDLIRCISDPNGLDSQFPLSSMKVYITNFAKNTVTLGTETDNTTYTSSNRTTTEQMEQTIKDIPGKKEILQEALREATDLINERTQSGHAIHTPNEFIVSDTEGVEDAKYLWRWGLGGLAHYSQGYDGPVDGVALTMDGKINGKMVLANSILAESIDIGYRSSVETTISESETAAKDYADNKVRVAKEDIETFITNMENRITLSVDSVKETVARKNYVVNGEQETLSVGSFTIADGTGSATVEKAEYLNLNCIKIKFASTGTVTLSQDVGTLEAGTYKISAETVYPENTSYMPSYIRYGFSGNTGYKYYNGYNPDELFTVSQTVQISKAQKTVQVSVHGYAGDVCYITNIRCLRDIQELLDDLSAKLEVEVGSVTASVNEVYNNVQHDYCVNGNFSDTSDAFASWTRSNTSYITAVTSESKKWAYLDRVSTTSSLYLYQRIQVPKASPFTIRFKAKCVSGQESKARIYVSFGGYGRYTNAGEMKSTYQTFELKFTSIPKANAYCYIHNYVSGTQVYITDIEILGYASGYSESQLQVLKDSITAEVTRAGNAEETLKASIKVNADNITSCVTKGNVGSYITQYYNNVIVAFNNSSKYVQIGAGEIAIYDYGITNQKKRAVFDESGNHFYRDGYYVGKIGTNQWVSNSAHKGLVFDLEPQGKYMAFSQKASSSASSYTAMLCFSRANSIYTEYGVHLGCDLYGEWYTLKKFKIGKISSGGYTGYTGSIPICTNVSISATSGGGVSWSYSHSRIRVYNGIIAGYWT